MKNEIKIREILFWTYLTNYNIKEIYYAIESGASQDVAQYLCEQAVNNKRPMPTEQTINQTIDKAQVDSDYAFEYIVYQKITPIPYFSKDYPASLKVLRDPPPLLFVKGKLKPMSLAAVVGTREVSTHAERVTSKIVGALVEKGYGIVSGLALGIDTLAHIGALRYQGYTIAVMPNSLDTVYPKSNIGLANMILDKGGALVSELCFNINRGRKSFVERNRIQAAFSEVVVPIEMSARSGTMHTINFSKQQKKRIYILQPASVQATLPQYEGIIDLIQQQRNNPKKNVCIVETMPDFMHRLENPSYPVAVQTDLFRDNDC